MKRTLSIILAFSLVITALTNASWAGSLTITTSGPDGQSRIVIDKTYETAETPPVLDTAAAPAPTETQDRRLDKMIDQEKKRLQRLLRDYKQQEVQARARRDSAERNRIEQDILTTQQRLRELDENPDAYFTRMRQQADEPKPVVYQPGTRRTVVWSPYLPYYYGTSYQTSGGVFWLGTKGAGVMIRGQQGSSSTTTTPLPVQPDASAPTGGTSGFPATDSGFPPLTD